MGCPRDARLSAEILCLQRHTPTHVKMAATIITLSALVSGALAAAEPAVTAAAMLYPRQSGIDPALVGYISASSGCEDLAESIKSH